MSDLVAWLREQIDEDERAAKAAGNRRWLVQDNIIELWPEREDDGFMAWPTRADARHAANWDPARVLAEVEAKRAIIERHASGPAGDCEHDGWPWPCPDVLTLAEVYRDRPGYDEAVRA